MAATKQMTGAERMLAACGRKPVDATPVWYMRQAGRCFPEYRELRKKYEILTIARTPELSAQVTLMPVEQLHVDAAVMFADIMLVLDGMGVPYHIAPETGPIIPDPIRTKSAVDAIRVVDAEEGTPYVLDAIREIKKQLKDSAALVGFSGSPFTLACYMIEGRPSRTFDLAKGLMFATPDLWHDLMKKITEVIVLYLRGQVQAGIQVAQLFDSWVGILSPQQYEKFVEPYSRRIFQEVSALGVPTIHFGTGNAVLLEKMAAVGCDIVSVDWRVPLDEAWDRIGHDRGIQGNLDPAMLTAPFDVVREGAMDVLHRADGRPGHVFNLGHGVLPNTNPADLARLVDLVHEQSCR